MDTWSSVITRKVCRREQQDSDNRSRLLLGGRLSGEFKPDRVIRSSFQSRRQLTSFLKCAKGNGFCRRILSAKSILTNSRVCIFRIGMLTNSVAHRWLQRAKRFVRGYSNFSCHPVDKRKFN